MTDTTCAIDGCGYPTRWRDLCNAHAVRLHRTGVRGGEVVRRGPKPRRECGVADCAESHYCGGYCTRHYQQIQKRGQIEPPRIVGPDHHSWRGEQITYRTAHNRVEAAYGPARNHSCVDCGGQAEHWSYDHRDEHEQVSPTGQPYSVKPEHYEPRCAACHWRFDRQSA